MVQAQALKRASSYEFVRRFEEFDVCCGDLVSSEFGGQNSCADIFKQPALRDDVAHVRNVVQGDGVRREQRRCHAWQRRVFGAANRDSAVKWAATRDTKLVHDAGQSK